MPHLNLALIGPHGHGKSTVGGAILVHTGAVSQRQAEKVAQTALEAGKPECKLAWVLDRLAVERERSLTVDIKVVSFTAPKLEVSMLDCPGSVCYVKNMLGGAAQCEAAVVVVSAIPVELDACLVEGGPLREHLLLAYTVGIKQLVVVVNKLDQAEFAEGVFVAAVEKVQAVLKKVGFAPKSVPFVPAAALSGENICTPSATKIPWYKGWTVELKEATAMTTMSGFTLLSAIDTLRPLPKAVDKPLRFIVHDTFKIAGVGVVVSGRLDAGTMVPGMRVAFAPGGLVVGEVVSIECRHKELKKAEAGGQIGVHMTGVTIADVKRGHVGGDAAVSAPRAAVSFVAQVILVAGDNIQAGNTPVLDCSHSHVPCKFRQILAKVDRKTGNVLEEFPASAKVGDTILVDMVPQGPLVVEPFADSAALGRFALRDGPRLMGIGVVKSVTFLDVPGSSAAVGGLAPKPSKF